MPGRETGPNNMQAIVTKYLPPTNTKGSRIKAQCARGSLTVSYPHELSGEECHIYAVHQLQHKFLFEDFNKYKTPRQNNPWGKAFATGCLPSGNYCHVFTKPAFNT